MDDDTGMPLPSRMDYIPPQETNSSSPDQASGRKRSGQETSQPRDKWATAQIPGLKYSCCKVEGYLLHNISNLLVAML